MVMNRILINATHAEEVRVAHLYDDNLVDYEVESSGQESNKGNIYKGKVTRIKKDLESAFVELGTERQGLLPLKKVMPQFFAGDFDPNRDHDLDVLKEGQELLVQINKEARGETKGPSVTTEFSLPGRYVVLKPSKPTGGVSTAISQDERDELRSIASKLNIPPGMGWIIRTSARNHTLVEIQDDLDSLIALWRVIEQKGNNKHVKSPQLIYKENTLIERILRDKLREDLDEVVIDDKQTHVESIRIAQEWFPTLANKLKLHTGRQPLFAHYRAEPKIKTLYDREVRLPSGGRIAIDPTEALVAIDVNSYRATQGTNLSETALNTNLEAATEIARQLKLRNLGGLFVVDFIDLQQSEDCKKVEDRMREQLNQDRAHTSMGTISTFGLMEIQRQRWRSSLFDTDFEKCDFCGHGYKRSVRSCAMEILRVLENGCFQEKYAEFEAQVPEEIGTYLLNNKRDYVHQLELATNTVLVVLPVPRLDLRETRINGYRQKRTSKTKNINAQLSVKPWMPQTKTPGNLNARSAANSADEPLVTREDAAEWKQQSNKAKQNQVNRKKKQRSRNVFQILIARVLSFFGVNVGSPKKQPSRKKRGQATSKPSTKYQSAKTNQKKHSKKKTKTEPKTTGASRNAEPQARRKGTKNQNLESKPSRTSVRRSNSERGSNAEQTSPKKKTRKREQPRRKDDGSVAKRQTQTQQKSTVEANVNKVDEQRDVRSGSDNQKVTKATRRNKREPRERKKPIKRRRSGGHGSIIKT